MVKDLTGDRETAEMAEMAITTGMIVPACHETTYRRFSNLEVYQWIENPCMIALSALS